MFKIRPVSANDAQEYQKLRNDNHQWFFSQKKFTEEEVCNWIYNVIGNLKDSVYVLEDTETSKLVGTVSLYNIQDGKAEVGRIAVDADRKGQGIGLHLLKEMEKFAMIRGLSTLQAEVMYTNIASKKLFLKAGYSIIKEDREKYTFELPIASLDDIHTFLGEME